MNDRMQVNQLIKKQIWPVNFQDDSAQIKYLQVLTLKSTKHQFRLFLSIFSRKTAGYSNIFKTKIPSSPAFLFQIDDGMECQVFVAPQLKGHPAVIWHWPFKNRA